MDCGPPGSSVHGISKARILEWVAISFSRGSSWPRSPALQADSLPLSHQGSTWQILFLINGGFPSVYFWINWGSERKDPPVTQAGPGACPTPSCDAPSAHVWLPPTSHWWVQSRGQLGALRTLAQNLPAPQEVSFYEHHGGEGPLWDCWGRRSPACL